MVKRWMSPLMLLCTTTSLLGFMGATAGRSLQVRVNRWLEVRQIAGTVLYHQGQQRQPASIGQRLQSVGDGLSTGSQSSSVLALDTGVGYIQVAENTALRVQELRSSENGGNITRLTVAHGQVQLRLRTFTNPDSRLEIQTPAGISGVRGTEFGVSVQPDGKTGVATRSGAVVSSAQGQSVHIGAGLQSLIVPGEAPTAPTPLRDSPQLNLKELRRVGEHHARLAGEIDPVNLLTIEGHPQATNREGHFETTVPLSRGHAVEAIVLTPLGTRQVYRLSVSRP